MYIRFCNARETFEKFLKVLLLLAKSMEKMSKVVKIKNNIKNGGNSMWKCKNCSENNPDSSQYCQSCGEKGNASSANVAYSVKKREEAFESMSRNRELKENEERLFSELILTTGNSFEGYRVVKYIDIVCEELIFKNSLWKRIGAGFEDLGNALSFSEREMSGASELIENARQYVLEKFKRKVVSLGANAVLGVDFESSFGSEVVRVAVFGTAVEIKKAE